ncbi:cisplatin damage response ATP-dependent DNA ligase [Amaricoccus sp.]|uniref:cisplatin damage response ATP-dependent DNA ligase n=1 Tax=Amaricoccus sp. TaxID=1872485 RepID=UPI001B54F21A|nr:cisplatin damage response ATP-dependent DNA ligase [Amaricoccus sp.]MBP7003642.1 cisplatin damage response ATP-dependent DNA ligase [Amaricoccus sp.]
MRRFAELLERLAFTPARNGKLRLLTGYLRETPDPDRGWALAAITGGLDVASVKPALLRDVTTARVDAELFALSYDFVGDLAETIALIWPTRGTADDPRLSTVVDALHAASRREAPQVVERLLDRLDPPARFALLKLVTGGLRVGVSARLAKQALADLGGRDVAEIEEVWHGLAPPYPELFAWLTAAGPRPAPASAAPFRPVMLSHPLEAEDLARLDPAAFAAEWKWDGIRVQAATGGGRRRLYSRTGDDISHAFPDLVEALTFDGALDGELLVRAGHGGAASFSDLQQRLNRKTVTPAQMRRFPAFLRAYDLLALDGSDLRPLPFAERRAALEALAPRLDPARIDLSPLLPFSTRGDLARLRAEPPEPVIEGVMLKRLDSPYLAGRPKGPWWKWKRDPRLIDAVLMYAQRGHGKRSGFYSDYTFGVWAADDTLVPVGKAYFGFTDAELAEIDRWVRHNTTERFGPVRAVRAEPEHGLVLEVAFEGLARSTRHRSGVAMRFPRISRLRWDKPPREADRIETLERMLEP